MTKIQTRIKTSFGEIIIEAEDPKQILFILQNMPENFAESVSEFVINKISPSKAELKGIVELTTEGPLVVTREKLTHYEAIGLILYASDNKTNTASKIKKLLESSGIKSMVPARLNEMTKRGRVFKPNPNKTDFKLTIQGEKWVEDEIITRIRGKMI